MTDWELVKKQLRDECREDHVGLWSIVRKVQEAGEYPKLMESTLTLIAQLLSEGQIVAGQFARTSPSAFEFNQWQMSPEDIISKIRIEWMDLGRDPNLGEIVWFVNKDVLR